MTAGIAREKAIIGELRKLGSVFVPGVSVQAVNGNGNGKRGDGDESGLLCFCLFHSSNC